MWTKSISLPIRKINGGQDDEGFSKATYEFMGGIPANFTDVTRNDETLASQKGYTAEQNVEVIACNYNGQSWLVDDETGDVYDIKRTYRKDKGKVLVLTCESRNRGKLPV